MTLKTMNLFAFVLALAAPSAFAAQYKIDPTHTSVGFKVRHLVSHVSGDFRDFEGTLSFDPSKPEAAQVKATLQTTSIDTANKKRDDHLRSADFFDAKKYPAITFVSKSVSRAASKGGEKKYVMTGDLTMHGVTKPVTMNIEFNGEAKDPWGNMRAGFSAEGKLNRKDFGINWNKALDAGGVVLGDEIQLSFNVEAVQSPQQ